MGALDGKVVALVCRGSEADRGIAVELADAGADIALATISRAQPEEFSTASIANEVWAIGREQFNAVCDAADAVEAMAFAEQVCDRLGRCDALVVAAGPIPLVSFDELSLDEWEPMLKGGLTAPLVLAQAFSRVIERGGGGTIILVDEAASHENLAGSLLSEAVRTLGAHLGIIWRERSLRALAVSREDAADRIIDALSGS
jgi:NAD(P)-dependent dehydrogenase (short-subunit alcohol dehydrogenase family)